MDESDERQPPPLRGGACRQQSRILTRMVSSLQDDVNSTRSPLRSIEEAARSRLFLNRNEVVGREQQLIHLDSVYKRIAKSHSEVVMIHGPSGAGKSALLKAFVREIPSSAFYITGKFDQLKSHAPYAALVSASGLLCRQILRRENSSDIRDRIRELLGPEINLLGSLIPTIAKMTADKEDSDRTGNARMGVQGFTRFKLLFRAFLRCVASEKNPIVLFLDDIQWADGSSLEVLKALVTDSLSKYIMIIGAYREGEMTEEVLQKYHLSSESIDTIDDSTSSAQSDHRAKVTDIEVTGLDASSLNDLIAAVLGMPKAKTLSLSSLVLNKTDGNAFYALNFLDMLLSRSLLSKTEDGLWTWDGKRILQETNVTDNLVAILEMNLRALPEQVYSILQIASFIGHSFTTEVLVAIVYEEQDMIEADCTFNKHSRQIIYDRILVTLKVAQDEGLLEITAETGKYKFSHDRVQRCLYSDLIPDDVERRLLHQRIGSLLWNSVKGMQTSDFDDWIFLAAENLNRAKTLIDISGTRYEVIEVNLRAAKLAMERSAFHLASAYLTTAVRLLEGDVSWDSHYDLCIDLYSTAAEAEKNIGSYERTKDLTWEIHKRAKIFGEQLEAYSIELDSLTVQGDLKGAILLGLHVLHHLDVKFPSKISMMTVAKEITLAKIAIGKRSLEDLLKLPDMTDKSRLVALNLMSRVSMNAFLLGDKYRETYAAVCIRMVRITVKYGLSLFSPMAFMAWGSVHSVLGQFDVSVRAEKLSMDVVEHFNAAPARARAVIMNYSMSHLWRCALDDSVRRDFLQAYHLAMSFGDTIYAHVGFISWLVSGIYLDAPLEKIHKRTRSVVAEGREYDSGMLLVFLLPPWQVLLNLSGDAKNLEPYSLVGEAFDESLATNMGNINSKVAIYGLHIDKLILAYTYEEWGLAEENLPFIRKLENEAEGYFTMGFNCSWTAACHYELYLISGKRKNKREGRRCHSKVKKWATTGTVMLSGANKWLAAIEALCVRKRPAKDVERMFKQAFVALAENGNRYFEALASERLARLYLTEAKQEEKGLAYLDRAIYLYRRWGALAKVKWLERRYS